MTVEEQYTTALKRFSLAVDGFQAGRLPRTGVLAAATKAQNLQRSLTKRGVDLAPLDPEGIGLAVRQMLGITNVTIVQTSKGE
jgi:hypothetical protein